MSPVYHNVQVQVRSRPTVQAILAKSRQLNVLVDAPEVAIVAAGNIGRRGPVGNTGPQGPPGQWTQMTQAAYNALPVKDPNTLYVIIG
jgi:hypothetical protein